MILFSCKDAKGAKMREPLPHLSLRALRSLREMSLVSPHPKLCLVLGVHMPKGEGKTTFAPAAHPGRIPGHRPIPQIACRGVPGS